MDTIRGVIQNLGFFGLLFTITFLCCGPIILWIKGTNELQSKISFRLIGITYRVGSVILIFIDVFLIISFGDIILARLYSSFGPMINGFFIVVTVCIVLFPICYLGGMLKTYKEATNKVKNNPNKKIKNRLKIKLYLSITLLIIVIILAIMLLPIKPALISVGLMLFAIWVGWSGSFIRPSIGGL